MKRILSPDDQRYLVHAISEWCIPNKIRKVVALILERAENIGEEMEKVLEDTCEAIRVLHVQMSLNDKAPATGGRGPYHFTQNPNWPELPMGPAPKRRRKKIRDPRRKKNMVGISNPPECPAWVVGFVQIKSPGEFKNFG